VFHVSNILSVQALGSSHKDVRLASAQVISKIATIELPKVVANFLFVIENLVVNFSFIQRDASGRSQWEDLMPTLLQWVVQPEASPAGEIPFSLSSVQSLNTSL
jgi:hypothetical protein